MLKKGRGHCRAWNVPPAEKLGKKTGRVSAVAFAGDAEGAALYRFMRREIRRYGFLRRSMTSRSEGTYTPPRKALRASSS